MNTDYTDFRSVNDFLILRVLRVFCGSLFLPLAGGAFGERALPFLEIRVHPWLALLSGVKPLKTKLILMGV
jgi:hypothetical protein